MRLALVSMLATTMLFCNDTEKNGHAEGIPRATIRAAALQDNITVSVSIPADHHAYLDEGPHGNLIPVAFDWEPALAAGKMDSAPTLKSKPEGEEEEKIGALVLRGTGEFVFQGSAKPGAPIRVRTQICNDVTGMCFRPTWQELSVE
ncbi:MAG: hypothetical protein KDK23_00085 [Leptospiraceae bacterium]|nr:hypothetical protein [Leptospiraceae bacterium]